MNTTTRRNFLKTGIALGAALTLREANNPLFAAPDTPASTALQTGPDGKPMLVAVRDGTRASMLDRALQALGGIERFVKKGQSVVIKPNVAWDVPPERSACTHPEVVGRLVELCIKAGAKKVSVFDRTCDQPRDNSPRCYDTSGVRPAVLKAGGVMVSGNDETLYREVKLPRGVRLQDTKVHSLILESDVFINVPVLKHHHGATITAAMKNLMGAIWDRRFYHSNDLHQCIADFISHPKLRPTLNITDAYAPMVRNGPRGKSVEDVVEMKTLLASTDIVAIDAASARMLDHAEDAIPHVRIAAAAGYGTCKLGTLKIERIRMA
ncbi:MAG: DUF362 domain-containing protein [Puniceicoccales bacterium]|jgi:uncharacterized protein (DUF362 family)|nr:DUF362 domain-containing protein [Puniceicoccales bacterium]